MDYSTYTSVCLERETQNMTEDNSLPREVVNKEGQRHTVKSILLIPKDGEEFNIALDLFNDRYEEYVDPKDVEIARLNEVIANLKVKNKKHSKPRRLITKAERLEIELLISNGETNRPIATQYGVSETVVSKMRVKMRKAGEDV